MKVSVCAFHIPGPFFSMLRYNRFSRKRALPMTLLKAWYKRAKKQIATPRKQQLQAFFPALFFSPLCTSNCMIHFSPVINCSACMLHFPVLCTSRKLNYFPALRMIDCMLNFFPRLTPTASWVLARFETIVYLHKLKGSFQITIYITLTNLNS